jgi:hypothetical protein
MTIDTKGIHPSLETGQVTAQLAIVSATIDEELSKIERQQCWHKELGPTHLCSILPWAKEPWNLIGLQKRLRPQYSNGECGQSPAL